MAQVKEKKIIAWLMKKTNFKDFTINKFLMKRNFDTKGDKFLWLHINHIQFKKGNMAMYFRTKWYGECVFRKVDRAKCEASLEDLKAHTFKVCYPSKLKISYKKYNDLMPQVQCIPSLYHDFFQTAKTWKPTKEMTWKFFTKLWTILILWRKYVAFRYFCFTIISRIKFELIYVYIW